MKGKLIFALMLLAGQLAAGQDRTGILKERLGSDRVTMSYKYDIDGKMPLGGNGTLLLQQGRYVLDGNGLQIISDGDAQYTIDAQAKEVYIEPAAEVAAFIASPELLLDKSSNLNISENEISGIYRDEASGSKISFRLWNIKFSPVKEDSGEFSFDIEALDGSWVVTDLR